MPHEWAPPAGYYQSQYPIQTNIQGAETPPSSQTTYYPSPHPQNQEAWTMPTAVPTTPQQWVSPPVHDLPFSTVHPSPLANSPSSHASLHSSPVQLEYIIPPKYNGDIVDRHGSKIYHLNTANDTSSTALSDSKGVTIGRIDWNKHASHTTINIRRNAWHRDQLLHPNKDKTFTFQVARHAGGPYTWKGFQSGIQCFDPSGRRIAEFPYRVTSVVRLDPYHAELVELVIVTALLIHYDQSRHGGHDKFFSKIGEGATEGIAEAIAEAAIKGMIGGA